MKLQTQQSYEELIQRLLKNQADKSQKEVT